MPVVAHVVLLPSASGIPEALTYEVPAHLREAAVPGVPVLVPLVGRDQLGYVLSVEELERVPNDWKLRPLKAVPRTDPAFDAATLELLRWVAREYRCSLPDTLSLAVPERHGMELESVLRLNGWDGECPPRTGLFTRQTLTAIHQALSEAGGELSRAELEAAVPALNFGMALRKAKAEGWIMEERVLRPPKVHAKVVKAIRLLPDGSNGNGATARLGERQRQVLDYLRRQGTEAIPQRQVAADLDVSASVVSGAVRSLAKHGLLEVTEATLRRAPGGAVGRDQAPPLTPFQGAAADHIHGAIQRGEGETLLLFGVTGSGKTEVYLHAIERARERGRTAVLLVPEISLTAQVAAAVRRRLGERVAILHSALSDGERFDEWERVRSGEADVVVGPRSALFSPLKDPALIILDEEHDGSYKQGSTPRYHARDAAQSRARISGGCVVLGSATPSMETYYRALQGEYQLLELPERVRQRPLPTVEVVDLRAETKVRPGAVFGRRLEDCIRQRVEAGEQVILFLNRRGFSSFLLCRDCGFVPRCPHCAVSLTLHRTRIGVLLCHHCAYSRKAPTTCPRCKGHRVRQFGLGTQRVEETVKELFPQARVARLDRDTTTAKGSHSKIIGAVANGEIDILVGTQMVTKGFDFPGVTLVGVVTADVALNMPDFRASERAFQLLTQVSGRAGRGDKPGEVVVQTFNPEHVSIQCASRHDYRGFYQREIQEREDTGYPPFGVLARLLSTHQHESAAQERLEAAAAILSPLAERYDVRVKGPGACPLTRLRDRYRYHLLLHASSRDALSAVLDEGWPQVQKRIGGITIDVEPVDLL